MSAPEGPWFSQADGHGTSLTKDGMTYFWDEDIAPEMNRMYAHVVRLFEAMLTQLVNDLEDGTVHLYDIDPELRDRFYKALTARTKESKPHHLVLEETT